MVECQEIKDFIGTGNNSDKSSLYDPHTFSQLLRQKIGQHSH